MISSNVIAKLGHALLALIGTALVKSVLSKRILVLSATLNGL